MGGSLWASAVLMVQGVLPSIILVASRWGRANTVGDTGGDRDGGYDGETMQYPVTPCGRAGHPGNTQEKALKSCHPLTSRGRGVTGVRWQLKCPTLLRSASRSGVCCQCLPLFGAAWDKVCLPTVRRALAMLPGPPDANHSMHPVPDGAAVGFQRCTEDCCSRHFIAKGF